MTQQYPILVVEGDVDNDGTPETGIFEMPNVTVEPLTLTEFLAQFGGGGGVTGAISAQLLNKGDQLAIDAGAGPRTFQIDFEGWTESNDYQWGNSSNSSTVTQATATGADRTTQVCVLNEYLNRVNIGSNNPATLHWGEYSESTSFADSGVYDPLDVAVPEINLPVPHNEESSTFRGSLTCVSVADISNITDGVSIPG